MKFSSCRGIIIKDNKLVVMQREKKGRRYCTFPGGHVEGNETNEECVVRELMEEFGIVVKPRRLIYGFESNGAMQGFFVLDWISGDIHKTDGEEYQENRKNGFYNPTMIDLSKLVEKNLVPEEIRDLLLNDLKTYGKELNREYIVIKKQCKCRC